MLKRKKQIIAKVMATTMLSSTLASTFVTTASAAQPKATVNSSTILAGTDRYETAIKISENGWSSATNAVLINGETGLVDALTATPYASLKNAPILITHKDNLTPATLTRLKAMNVKNVDIVGGVNSVSENVVNQLKANGMTVNRIAGNSRYETGLAVAKAMDKISDVSKIAVVNGEKGLPDAVSVAAPAADNKMPIILAHPTNGLDAATKTFINGESISKSYVIGSITSMPDSIANSLPGTKTRLGGTDRHDTNAKVIKEFYTQKELDNIYVAKSGYVNNDTELVDALAAGVLAAKNDDPVLIVGKTLGTTQESLLKDKSFTKITQIGGNIPTASINAIKDTQKDPEATVSTVTLVNYKTIKITGKELNRIDRSNVSISGNTTSSYTVNSAGTEATVEFANAFSNGTNTVKITSNLGNTTTHTFTYSTGISTVEATTKEVATEGIQYLEFTVNGGQKRTIEELKALGWTVEFKANAEVFYALDGSGNPTKSKTSTTGQLKTNEKFSTTDEFYYQVILKNGDKTITSEKKNVTCEDKSNYVKEIRDYDLTFEYKVKQNDSTTTAFEMNSRTLLIGEVLKVPKIKVTNLNGTQSDDVTSGYTIESSNENVLPVSPDGTELIAKAAGESIVTIKMGNVSKEFKITVKENTESNKRKPAKFEFETTNLKMLTTDSEKTVNVIVKDAYGDPVPSKEIDSKLTWTTQVINSDKKSVATALLESTTTNNKGQFVMKVTQKLETGLTKSSGTVKLQYDGKDISGTSLTVNVSTPEGQTGKDSYKLESLSSINDLTLDRYAKKSDNVLELALNKYTSEGYFKEKVNLTQFGSNEDDYAIEVSDGEILSKDDITIDSTNKTIKFTLNSDGKTGNVKITLYQFVGANKTKTERASVTVTVKDTTPRIKNIAMKNDITEITEFKRDKSGSDIPDFKLEDLFEIKKIAIPQQGKSGSAYRNVIEPETIELTGTQIDNITEVSIDFGGGSTLPVIFMDKDKNGTYDSGEDLLATISLEYTNGINVKTENTNAYQIVLDENENQRGNINVRLYHGVYNSNTVTKPQFASKTIHVNIEKE
ncbi:cell wall-binding repeat-containing protein [Romboutsia ilealis]|uniref:cell wall-binding repeat-containing protein n=1 Tax=Romboutsia ilealis TaxID=1115758 RepID=UPI00289EF006|nr:cell wall-binding repeat-containing protein [Romboutsia ilealis]